MANPLILCIDLDEWYHARWASGSKKARWQRLEDLFRDYYHSDRPSGEVKRPTKFILKTLKDRKIKATFFILGEVAQWYPDLVKAIAKDGHEIACHGMHHQDLTIIGKYRFAQELSESRQILEKLSGQKVMGFRAPNLVVTKWLTEVLIDQGFKYDSSICPGRSIQGKYQGQSQLPLNPYRMGDFWEIPIPTFPILKLPGAVSIASRIFGFSWTTVTLENALRTGAACYYAHPYEFNPPPRLNNLSLREKVFMRRMGSPMEKIFKQLLAKYQGRIISIRDYLSGIKNAPKTIKN